MTEMKNKLISYWKLSLPTAEICMILDPRQKTEYFDTTNSMKDAVKRFQEIYKTYKPENKEYDSTDANPVPNKSISMFARFIKTR